MYTCLFDTVCTLHRQTTVKVQNVTCKDNEGTRLLLHRNIQYQHVWKSHLDYCVFEPDSLKSKRQLLSKPLFLNLAQS